MKTKIWLLLILVLGISACSPPAAVTTQPPAATQAATSTPAAGDPTVASTAAPTMDPPAAAKVTYKIVPGESKVTYEVGETFLNQNNRFNLAVGVTSVVNGEIHADLADPPASSLGEFSIDISQFTSDSNRRDNAIRRDWLESTKFPMAVFKPTRIESLPASYTEGQAYTFRVTGDLTVKETTRPVTFDISASLQGDTLSGKATTTILMSAFGVGLISILGVLTTEDEARLTLDFVARP